MIAESTAHTRGEGRTAAGGMPHCCCGEANAERSYEANLPKIKKKYRTTGLVHVQTQLCYYCYHRGLQVHVQTQDTSETVAHITATLTATQRGASSPSMCMIQLVKAFC